MANIESQRNLFDIPPDISYFNCAYNSPLLVKAGDALVKGALSKRHPWDRKPNDFFDDAEKFRKLTAKALGGNPECFAVVPSASYGLTAAARILEDHMGKGDEIIVLEEAFSSNYLPWLRLSQVTGARMVVAKTPTDLNWTQAVLDRITPQTKLIAVCNCHWTNGALLDLVEIKKAAQVMDAYLTLDVTQSLGAMPLDFEAVRPDFAVASGYKWLLFPYGLSLFYADPKWHHARPLEETWINRDGAEIFEKLTNYSDVYKPGARRFEMGQKCIPSLLPGGLVALEQLGGWGVANIAASLEEINDRIALALQEIGLTPIPKKHRSPHILGVSSDQGLPDELIPQLASKNIFISRRGSSLRFAPHLYINENDLDRLFETLKAVF
ncbi:aminotransferase class V-fold PLP-dependent enzyme [Dethiosulfatarculus sandiegensis]|uniref:aminotransferase class V-fold PLP-dependent enzyme n=1 Tax=Dethiosulfatarculus sandiegensis TaxID=1429043 RepID=UPI000ACFEA64|nr:aminotransferase class V-fold PLP-dependent enzyme [Dethiosulfatarculus sandiegensis]